MNMTKGSENPNKKSTKKLHNKLLYVTIFLREKGGRGMEGQTEDRRGKSKAKATKNNRTKR